MSSDCDPRRPIAGTAFLTPGRSLRFAPDWACSDASVLFDRNSGDYWVISSLAATVIGLLDTHGAMTILEVDRRLAPPHAQADLRGELAPTWHSLEDNGLIATVSGPVRMATPAAGRSD